MQLQHPLPTKSKKNLLTLLLDKNLDIETYRNVDGTTNIYFRDAILGEGGIGTVFQGYRLGGDPCVIKTIHPELNSPHLTPIESHALIKPLNSHNLAKIFGLYSDPDVISMEYLDGSDAKSLVGQVDENTILKILKGMSNALSVLDSSDLIHRDIKPNNIFVTKDDRVVLIDYDLVVKSNYEHFPDLIFGSLTHISPEQARGERVTHKSDIYSLGISLIHLLLGEETFNNVINGVSFNAILNRRSKGKFPLPLNWDNNISSNLSKILKEMTVPAPEDRPNANDLVSLTL